MLYRQPATTDFLPAYEQLLDARNIPAKARPYYLRWAKAWITTAEPDDPSAAREFFQTLGRRSSLPAWQFQQAVGAVAWLARDILHIPWAESFDWRGLADQAKPLEPGHRTFGRETIRVPPEKRLPQLPQARCPRRPNRPRPPRPYRRVYHHDSPPRHETPRRRRSQPTRHDVTFSPVKPYYFPAQVSQKRKIAP